MNWRAVLHVRFLCLLLALPSMPASALPELVRDHLRDRFGLATTQMRPLGSGEMRWLGLSIYHASLWTAATRFDDAEPFALVLRYSRDIPGSRLVATSLDELERLGTRDQEVLKRWRGWLVGVFPDVKTGESIVGVYLPLRGAAFYHQGRLTGEILDAEFARAFFAIWLDEQTRAPDLRARLLGNP